MTAFGRTVEVGLALTLLVAAKGGEHVSLPALPNPARRATTAETRSRLPEPVRFEAQPSTLPVNSAEVWCVAYSPDGETLAVAGADQAVKLCDVATGHLKKLLKGHGDVVA